MEGWIWSALGTLVSGAFLYIFTRMSRRADAHRDALAKNLEANTRLTERTAWGVETLSKHVEKQNGRIEKLEDRVYRIDGRRIYKKGDDGPE